MRRKDREITNLQEIVDVIDNCDVCRIAFFDDIYPYIIPMNFGFKIENNKIILYFHCAPDGQKLDLLRKNPNVSFEMDCGHKLITGSSACEYTMEYASVIGNGVASFVTDDKISALDCIMGKYSSDKIFKYSDSHINTVTIFKIDVHNITGKKLKVK